MRDRIHIPQPPVPGQIIEWGVQRLQVAKLKPHVARGGIETELVVWVGHCLTCGEAFESCRKPGDRPSRYCTAHRRQPAAPTTRLAPSWLTRAVEAARKVQSPLRGQFDGRHSVYVVLLERLTPRPETGVYVGETYKDPGERFLIPKAGGRQSSRVVRAHGVRLLPALYDHLNPVPNRAESQRLEKELHAALAKIVPWAEGGH